MIRHLQYYFGVASVGVVAIAGAAMNGQYASTLGTTERAALILVAAFVALDVVKWQLPGWAAAARRERRSLSACVAVLCLIGCMLVSLTSSVSFSVQNRGDVAAQRAQSAFNQGDAEETVRRLQATLEEMQTSSRWASSDGCANATVERSISFCARYDEARRALAEARAQTRERPAVGVSDPMVKIVATWEAFADQGWALIVIGLFFGLVIELVSSLGFFLLGPRPQPESADTRLDAVETVATGVAHLPGMADIIQFSRECLVRARFARPVSMHDAYDAYRAWARAQGRHAVSRVAFDGLLPRVLRHRPGPGGGTLPGWRLVQPTMPAEPVATVAPTVRAVHS